MNNLLRNVLMRRSTHKFDMRQLRDEDLQSILEEGKLLSHAAENQAWHFTVVQNQGVLQQIALVNTKFLSREHKDIVKEGIFKEEVGFISRIPTLLIISVCSNASYAEDAANTVFGSMMLIAEKIGVAACWLSSMPQVFHEPEAGEINRIISIPEGYVPLCVGAFGYKQREESLETASFSDSIVHIIK